ncbi:MAG: ParA family protein [Proteobacteria bacterium]|nr:ParA family protein [Pseudomonadota bacterium]
MFLKTRVDYLMNDLEELRDKGLKLVFVDSPPVVTGIIEQIVSHADLVVVPIRPSPHDLRAVGATLDIIEAQGKPLIFAVNGATPQAQITSETAVALSQHGTVAPSTIHQRTDFATSMINGNTVMEMNPESRSAKEIIGLWDYIALRLDKIERQRPNRRVNVIPFQGDERRTLDRGRGFGRRIAARSFGKRLSE